MDESILMKLYTVVLYDQRMWMKEDVLDQSKNVCEPLLFHVLDQSKNVCEPLLFHVLV